MLEAYFSVFRSLKHLSYHFIQIVMVNVCLEALPIVGNHLSEEHNWLEQRGDHGLSECHHLLKRKVLLLGKLGSSADQ